MVFGNNFPLCLEDQLANNPSLFCLFSGSIQQVGLSPLAWSCALRMGHRRKSCWWGKQALNPPPHKTHCSNNDIPSLPAWFSAATCAPGLDQISHSSPNDTIVPSSQHGYSLPVEAVIAEARVLPGQLWVHLGHDATAFHHTATSNPREQRCAETANPGPQQALYQGPGWGESKCHGWALRGYHDSLRWVASACWCSEFASYCIGWFICIIRNSYI